MKLYVVCLWGCVLSVKLYVVCLWSYMLCFYEIMCCVSIKLCCVLWSCVSVELCVCLWSCVICVYEVVCCVSMRLCVVWLWSVVLCLCYTCYTRVCFALVGQSSILICNGTWHFFLLFLKKKKYLNFKKWLETCEMVLQDIDSQFRLTISLISSPSLR